MTILVACEESQRVTHFLREKGLEAFSCDILPTSGDNPQWHIQTKVEDILYSKEWEMVLAFPPCTHLAVSGARHFEKKRKDGRQQQGIDFFMLFVTHPCKLIAIENPVGIMSSLWRKPDQIIQPWMFGEEVSKKTCLWLKGLPPLTPTKVVNKGCSKIYKGGSKMSEWYSKTSNLPHHQRSVARSKTFVGIASAMANQWGEFYKKLYKGEKNNVH